MSVSEQAGDLLSEAVILNNMAFGYIDTNNKEKAVDYFRLALPIYQQLADRDGQSGNLGRSWLGEEAGIIGNICYTLDQLGLHKDALDQCSRALQIYEELGMSDRAEMMIDIGNVYEELGERNVAVDYFQRALPIVTGVDQDLEGRAYTSLMKHYSTEQPALAILYGKEAIKRLQVARGQLVPDKEVKKSFIVDFGRTYADLADLLIQSGRLPEAQQVLNFLKDQEYKDYVRGETGDTLGSLSLTPAEQRAEEDYQRSTAKAIEQGRRWSELKQIKSRTPEEEKEFEQLSDSVGKASGLMNEYFARLYKLFSAGEANRQVVSINDETALLKQEIAKMPHTVALYTVVSAGRYSVIVINGPTMVAREHVIPDRDLYQKVAAFRQTIFDPSKDPKPLAQELYNILIGPIKGDLEQAKAETLIWSLDGVLRYVPFAALYDGQHYLVESYSLASFTPVSIAHISERPDLSAVSAVGMGISAKLDEKLQALPKVEAELDRIVQDPQMKGSAGVMPGTILLNARFTEAAMEKQLDGKHPVVHIASHFVIRPGDDSQSYLLLAGTESGSAGHHMTVAEFRDDQKMSLEGTELLTLSACDTGVGGSSANGREVDGLATTAQRKGAKSVISSLWEIKDDSTTDLMADFYKRWVDGGGKVTKAEALREAQIDLLLGKVTAKTYGGGANAGGSYAQPFYWAPFVLMGNWQ